MSDLSNQQKKFSLGFDSEEIERQLTEMVELLQVSFEVTHETLDKLHCLFSDIVLSDRVTTVSASGPKQLIIRPRFGRLFEDFMSALRAGKRDWLVHEYPFLKLVHN